MSLSALTVAVELEQHVCGQCGGTYAIAERVAQQKRDNSGYWHCPYCQCSWGYGKGKLQKTQEELESERQRHATTLARLNETSAELDKTKKAAARVRSRIQKGVCPCCNRSFTDLRKHMASKHPEQLAGGKP